MSSVVKRSGAGSIKTGAQRGGPRDAAPPPRWVPPQLCQLVKVPPSGPQWVHEIKLDGFRMSGRIEQGRAQLLTRTGLDWSDKYPEITAVSGGEGRLSRWRAMRDRRGWLAELRTDPG